MFFLLRTAFWISLLLLVLPFGDPKSNGPTSGDKASIDAMSAFAAAGATISDMTSFCKRQPDACAVGGEALKLVGERAKVGASALSDYFGKNDKPPAKPEPAELRTGSAGVETAATPTAAGRQTLTPADRKPAWRGPAA